MAKTEKMKNKQKRWKFGMLAIFMISVISGIIIWQFQNKEVKAAGEVYITDSTTSGQIPSVITIKGNPYSVVLEWDKGKYKIGADTEITWAIAKDVNDADTGTVVELLPGEGTGAASQVTKQLKPLMPGQITLVATVKNLKNSSGENVNEVYTASVVVNVEPDVIRSSDKGFFSATNTEVNEDSWPLKIEKLGDAGAVELDFKYIDMKDEAGNRRENLASWKSEDPNIATVDEKTGVIRGVSAGRTNIIITSYTGSLVERVEVYVAPLVKDVTEGDDQFRSRLPITISQGNKAYFQFDSGDAKNIDWRVSTNGENSATTEHDLISVGGSLTSNRITLSPSYDPDTKKGTMTVTATAGTYYIYMYVKGCSGYPAVPYAMITITIPAAFPDNDVVVMNVGDTYNILDSFNISADTFKDYFESMSFVTGGEADADGTVFDDTSIDLNGLNYIITGLRRGASKIVFKSKEQVDGVAKEYYIIVRVVDTIALNRSTASIYVGQSIKLQAITTDNSLVSWTSSNPDIATVDNDGNVTGISDSTEIVTITASQRINGVTKKAVCRVTVTKAITGIEINPATVTLDVGKKETIKASFIPSDLTGNLNIKWVSSDISVVDIIEDNVKTITIEGKKGGTAVISAINLDNAVVGTCKVTVQQAIESLELSYTNLTINLPGQNSISETFQLMAIYGPTNATATDIVWQSTNPTVATVSEKTGLVTAKSPGTTVIIAKPAYNPNNVSAMCTFTVNQSTTGITLDVSSKTMEAGDTYRMTYTIQPTTATNKKVTWTSMDTKIATVTEGLITAVSAGQTYIVARTEDGYMATCTITVTQAASGIKLSTNDLTMRVGDIFYVDATVTPAGATETKFTWTSQDTDIATVDSSGKVTAIGAGKTMILVKTKKGDLQYLYVTVQESATGLELNYTEKTLLLNKTFTLVPKFTPEDVSNKNVTWKTSNKNVATVTTKGVVKAVKGGTALITCTAEDGGYVATCVVTVKEAVTSITLNKSSYKLGKGKSITLKATIKTNSASNQALKWTSSNTKVATVNSKGKVTGKSVGTAVITCTATDGSGANAECTIRVVQQATSLKLNKTSISVLEGKSYKLKATIKPSDASYKTVTWSSSDETIATVDTAGNIVALKAGNCKIYAKAKDNSGLSAVCWVYVTTRVPATGITVSQKDMVMVSGATDIVAVSIQPATTTDTIRYASDNTAVASVTSKGKVTARKPGAATITVTTSNGKMAMVNVAVVGLNASSITMTQYTQETLWVEEVTTGVKWRSVNPEIASVANGVVTARKPGRTQIEATVKGRKLYCTVTVNAIK